MAVRMRPGRAERTRLLRTAGERSLALLAQLGAQGGRSGRPGRPLSLDLNYALKSIWHNKQILRVSGCEEQQHGGKRCSTYINSLYLYYNFMKYRALTCMKIIDSSLPIRR